MALQPIINPNNLHIEGWYCSQLHEKGEFILPATEVRDLIAKGLVVDDHEALTHPDDLVRLRDCIELRYTVLGKPVRTEKGVKLGKVVDFAVEEHSYSIQKLYIQPTLFKGLLQQQHSIDRSSIVEITDQEITVRDGSVPVGAAVGMPAQA